MPNPSRRYRVTVCRQVTLIQTFEVDAVNEGAAESLAEQEAVNADWSHEICTVEKTDIDRRDLDAVSVEEIGA